MYDIVIGRSERDKEKFGKRGTIFIGRQYVKMGRVTSLSNNVYIDVSGAHVIFICGKRGAGKCLTGDTLVTLDDGTTIPIMRLYKDSKRILALDHNLKISQSQKEGFYEREVEEILRIKLRSGKEISLTPEHPLLTVKGWVEARNLSKGSRIATPRKIPVKGELIEDEAKIKILAYMIAEGHTKKAMLFSNKDEKIVEDMRKSLKDLDRCLEMTELQNHCYKINSRDIKRNVIGYEAVRDDKGRFSKGSCIEFEKTPIRQLMEEYGVYNKLSTEKGISPRINRFTNCKLALFLNRLFSCDGSIYRKKSKKGHTWQISYSTSSKVMAKQIQSLLLRFEIISLLRKKIVRFNENDFATYELVISSDNVERFITSIGFIGRKEDISKQALEELKHCNPNIDTIPKELWDIYRPNSWVEAGKALGYSSPKAARSSINYSASRAKLLQIAESDCNQRMKMLAQSDIFWDEIISIEWCYGKTKVYDISVPELHNFIANDIIVHNSYTMGVIAEGLADLEPDVRQNLSFILLDTMGIYWTMKYPNKPDEILLEKWGLKGRGLDVKIYTPQAYHKIYKDKGIPTDHPFSVKPSELDASDWQLTFDVSANDPIGVLIERIVYDLKDKGIDYDIEDMIKAVEADKKTESTVKDALINRLLSTEAWGVFSRQGTSMNDLAKGGEVIVLDVSCYATTPGGWKVKALIVGLISKKLFIQRMIERKNEEYDTVHAATHYFSEGEKKEKLDMPLVWLVIDEAHEFLPVEGKTAASDALITILREGRQPGISLILATQQPGKIHTDVMTQSDTVLSHRITAKIDVDALGMLMQSYMREGLNVQIDNLPRVKGAAVMF
ncbi:hypothetical protein GF345_01125, partial [Candidatus Woesearchaeota archaeon]|nr:hypothetical protein [Candidatus Woesearchaeota archaeon]